MADTIITNTPGQNDSGSGGWVVAVVILLAVIAGGFIWYRYYRHVPAPSTTNINVTIPTGTATGGATQ
jgi:hypothetical protein